MIDILAPLGLLALVGFVVAVIFTARKQRDARQWTVCIIRTARRLGPDSIIHPRDGTPIPGLDHIPAVKAGVADFDKRFEMRAVDTSGARDMLDEELCALLLRGSESLPFPVEVQLRDCRLAAYPARRNDAAGNSEDLRMLVDFAGALVRKLSARRRTLS